MDITFRELPQPGDIGYPMTRLEIHMDGEGPKSVLVHAAGFYLDPEFLVLRKSQAFVEMEPGFEHPNDGGTQELRDLLIEDGTLVRRGAWYVFETDYVFATLSLAAGVVLGRPTSGFEEWRDINNTKLADLLAVPASA